jgi:hypothetical protein
MKIGRISIDFFRNYKLGPEFGKPVCNFYVRIERSTFSAHFFTWCLYIRYQKRWVSRGGKPVSISEFKRVMQARGVDLLKSVPVEISVNGIRPIEL